MLNLAPQSRDFNRVSHWRWVENQIAMTAKNLGNNLKYIDWQIIIWYNNSNRPVKYIVYYNIKNSQGITVEENAIELE
jgi:intein-encoded DNA endonuclease-like protein